MKIHFTFFPSLIFITLYICSGNLSSQNTGLGITAPLGRLHIKGSSNISQLIIDANSTQTNTNPLISLRGIYADLFWIHSDHQTNTFIGKNAGLQNLVFETYGTNNTFIGEGTGSSNLSGYNNTRVGFYSSGSQNGFANTAMGGYTLYAGNYNTAYGLHALIQNEGNYNTGFGGRTLFFTMNSNYNLAVGYNAGDQYNYGWNNVFVGANSDASGANFYNMIAAGSWALCTDVSQTRLGNDVTGSIGGYANWTNISDGRFKKNVRDNVKGLEFIRLLRPVTYQLDVSGINDFLHEDHVSEMSEQMKGAMLCKEEIIQSGFIAQEVEAAARSVGFDFSGIDAPGNEKSLYGLRYGQFVVPLVKAVQELDHHIETLNADHRRKEQIKSDLADLKKNIETLKTLRQ